MLKLYVIRHGKAVKTSKSGQDFDRELNTKGNAQINQIGEILRRTGAVSDLILTSSAQRTTETADIINHYIKSSNIVYDENLYLVERDKIESILKNKATGKSIVLVGHNYGLSDFVNYCCNENLLLSTGMLVEIKFNFDNWQEIGRNKGQLINRIQPEVITF